MANKQEKNNVNLIILSTLSTGDKYGFEIIAEANKDGIILKQPTLYGALKKLEDQNYISSYWRDSEAGGKRHYYRITDYGKKQLSNLKISISTTPQTAINSSPKPATNKPNSLQTNLFDNSYGTSISPADFSPASKMQEVDSSAADIKISAQNDGRDAVLLTENERIDTNFFDCDKSNVCEEKNDDRQPEINKFASSSEMPAIEINEEYNDVKIPANDDASITNSTKSDALNPNNTDDSFDIFKQISIRKKGNGFCSDTFTECENVHEECAGKEFAEEIKNNEIALDSDLKVDDSTSIQHNDENTTPIPSQNGNKASDDAKLIVERIEHVDLLSARSASIKDSSQRIAQNLTNLADDNLINLNPKSKSPDLLDALYDSAIKSDNSADNLQNEITHSGQNERYKYIEYEHNKSHINKASMFNVFKHKLITCAFSFGVLLAIIAVLFLAIYKTVGVQINEIWIYVLPAVLFISLYTIYLFTLSKSKDKLSYNYNHNHLLYCRIFISLLIIIITCVVNTSIGLQANNFARFASSMLVPIFTSLIFPIISLVEYFCKKFKFIYK